MSIESATIMALFFGPSALALLLGADLGCAPKRLLEDSLKLALAFDLAADVADQAAEPRPRQTQLPSVALELLGMGIASRHHRRMHELGVGRKGDGLGLNGGVHHHPLQIARPQRAGLVRHPQALGQQQLQLIAKPLAPVAEVRELVGESVLEELFAGAELE